MFFFKGFFLNFELDFFDFVLNLNIFDDLRFFFDEVSHEICDLYVIIISNELISLRAIHYRSIEGYEGS